MTVVPGSSASLSVVIETPGDRTESSTIIPAGLSAAWTTVMLTYRHPVRRVTRT